MTDAERLELIARIARRYALDDNLGDTTERAETILWIATAGREGRDWGMR